MTNNCLSFYIPAFSRLKLVNSLRLLKKKDLVALLNVILMFFKQKNQFYEIKKCKGEKTVETTVQTTVRAAS